MRGIEPKLSLGESRTKKIMSNFYIKWGKTRFLTEIWELKDLLIAEKCAEILRDSKRKWW